jgi:hypothetical protein
VPFHQELDSLLDLIGLVGGRFGGGRRHHHQHWQVRRRLFVLGLLLQPLAVFDQRIGKARA